MFKDPTTTTGARIKGQNESAVPHAKNQRSAALAFIVTLPTRTIKDGYYSWSALVNQINTFLPGEKGKEEWKKTKKNDRKNGCLKG